MRTIAATPKRTRHGSHDDESACHARAVEPGRADPGRLDWFTSAVLPDGGQRVRICRCARSTPSEAVELDSGTSVLQRNPADLRGLGALGELARVDPAVSWPAARQAVLRCGAAGGAARLLAGVEEARSGLTAAAEAVAAFGPGRLDAWPGKCRG